MAKGPRIGTGCTQVPLVGEGLVPSQLEGAHKGLPYGGFWTLRSASETEYHLLLARDLGYLDIKTYEGLNNQATEVKRMLTGFLQKLNADG